VFDVTKIIATINSCLEKDGDDSKNALDFGVCRSRPLTTGFRRCWRRRHRAAGLHEGKYCCLNAMQLMFKGEKPFEAAAAKAVSGIEFICGDWATFWPQDSQTVSGLKSRAEGAVWTDAPGFQRSSDAYFAALKTLAESKDEAGVTTNFPALGKACSACHETYRTPEN
jgi:cytochrome c556